MLYGVRCGRVVVDAVSTFQYLRNYRPARSTYLLIMFIELSFIFFPTKPLILGFSGQIKRAKTKMRGMKIAEVKSLSLMRA